MAILTRFAPSPTGYLHRGHARAAAEAFGAGPCLLRIEDIDHTRCRPEYTDAIYEDLRWLGFDWPTPVRVQSEHYAAYAAVVIELLERGLAYPCALSRTDLKGGKRTETRPGDGAIGRAAARLREAARYKTPSLPFAIRLNVSRALRQVPTVLSYHETGQMRDARPDVQIWSNSDRPDPIIARRDISASYHIAVTHDDALQNITHVVRGRDLIDETPLHVLIQNLLGWPVPEYRHHEIVIGDDGKKLSKTAKSETLRHMRETGGTAEESLTLK